MPHSSGGGSFGGGWHSGSSHSNSRSMSNHKVSKTYFPQARTFVCYSRGRTKLIS